MGARRADGDLERLSWVAYAAGLPAQCSQCGKMWRARACGPTHAAVAAARATWRRHRRPARNT
jgi:hypothetical protein